MKRIEFMLAACLMLSGTSVPAHEASPGNANRVLDCGYIVTTVSNGDFADCSINHRREQDCLKWAYERKAELDSGIGAFCERRVREIERYSECAGVAIRYHRHMGDECSPQQGCTGRDGNAPPHVHWTDVHVSVECE